MANTNFYVVGIGLSEGGIGPLCDILDLLPTGLNAAFMIVKHLHPEFPSFTGQILETHTRMKISTGAPLSLLKPGRIYLLPVGKTMEIKNAAINLRTRDPKVVINRAIDILFNSLADDLTSRAIGVLLSGSGPDGSIGLANIAAQGGLTIAQLPQTARYPKMPESAITMGAANFILSPARIAELLREVIK